MKARKSLAMLAMVLLVCVSLTGCVVAASVTGENGKVYPLYSMGGLVPTKGTVLMIAMDGFSVVNDDLLRVQDPEYFVTVNDDTQVVFNPLQSGKKLTVNAEDIDAVFFDEESGWEGIAMAVPYELEPGDYVVTLEGNDFLTPSKIKFDIYEKDGRESSYVSTAQVHKIDLSIAEDLYGDDDMVISYDGDLYMTVVGTVPTGDASHLMMWAALVGAGCIGLAVLLMKKRSVR